MQNALHGLNIFNIRTAHCPTSTTPHLLFPLCIGFPHPLVVFQLKASNVRASNVGACNVFLEKTSNVRTSNVTAPSAFQILTVVEQNWSLFGTGYKNHFLKFSMAGGCMSPPSQFYNNGLMNFNLIAQAYPSR